MFDARHRASVIRPSGYSYEPWVSNEHIFFLRQATRYTEQFRKAANRGGWEGLDHEVHRSHEIRHSRAELLSSMIEITVLLDKHGLLER